MLTHLIKYKARAHINSGNHGIGTEADCTFWITNKDEQSAMACALNYGYEMGWSFMSWQLITVADRQSCSDNPYHLERFESAQQDGAACIIEIYQQDEQ